VLVSHLAARCNLGRAVLRCCPVPHLDVPRRASLAHTSAAAAAAGLSLCEPAVQRPAQRQRQRSSCCTAALLQLQLLLRHLELSIQCKSISSFGVAKVNFLSERTLSCIDSDNARKETRR
jgi:hypothetical protein